MSVTLSCVHLPVQLLTAAKFSDVTIKIYDSSFRLHKAILANGSCMLEALLTGGLAKEKGPVCLDELPGGAGGFRELLRFFYGDRLSVSENNAATLYAAADYLQASAAKEVVSDWLTQSARRGSVAQIIRSMEVSPLMAVAVVQILLSGGASPEEVTREMCVWMCCKEPFSTIMPYFASCWEVLPQPDYLDVRKLVQLLHMAACNYGLGSSLVSSDAPTSPTRSGSLSGLRRRSISSSESPSTGPVTQSPIDVLCQLVASRLEWVPELSQLCVPCFMKLLEAGKAQNVIDRRQKQYALVCAHYLRLNLEQISCDVLNHVMELLGVDKWEDHAQLFDIVLQIQENAKTHQWDLKNRDQMWDYVDFTNLPESYLLLALKRGDGEVPIRCILKGFMKLREDMVRYGRQHQEDLALLQMKSDDLAAVQAQLQLSILSEKRALGEIYGFKPPTSVSGPATVRAAPPQTMYYPTGSTAMFTAMGLLPTPNPAGWATATPPPQ